MKKTSSLIALAGALALLGSQTALAETKQPASTQNVKPVAKKAHEGACGEGKCGASTKKASKAAEGKCGEGKCGASTKTKKASKAAEGKCGEGKCGSK